jgi:DNA-binding CsgD family transcriptional regulator/DNA polymerase III delta prime subunit
MSRREVIGRDEEVARLHSFVSSLRAGPVALVLAGEPGIGKTTLWHAGVEAARERSLLVLTARPAEAEAKLSFAAVGDLLDPVLDEVLPPLPRPQRRALEIALLLEEAAGPAPDRRAVAVALLTAVRALADTGPMVLAVDDVQWLDAASDSVLRFVARRLGEAAVGLLLAQRIVAPTRAPLDLDRALPGDRLASLQVGPLRVGALHRLLHERLGAAFPRPVLLRLHEASGGNPFFALEIGRALERGATRPAPGEPLPVPRSLDELVRARVASLPTETQATLLAAAALSQPTRALLEAVTPADAQKRLQPALEAHVIELDGERIRFSHPLLAACVYEGAYAEERRAAHARLAAVVSDLEERARHLALAAEGPDPAVAAELDRAALHASARGAPAVAAELSELAARLTPSDDAEARCRRLVEAAEQHHTAGRLARTREILEPLVDELPAGRERARALFQLGWTEQSWERGHELCEQALAVAREEELLRAKIHHWLGFVWIVRGDLARAGRHAEEAVALAERTGDAVSLVSALSLLVLVDTLAGTPVPEARLDRALALEEAAQGEPLYYSPSLVHALRLMYRDRLDEARRGYEKALRIVAERGDEEMVCAITLHLAQLECRAGNWDRAAEHAARGYDLCQALGLEDRQGTLRYAQALVAAHQGRVEEGRAFAEEAIAITEASGDAGWEIEARTVLGFLELSLGDPEAAARQLRPLPARLMAMGYGEPGFNQSVPDLIEALVALGEAEEAHPLTAWLEERGRTLDAPLARARLARCRGLVAAARGDVEAGLAALDAALAEHRRAPVPFERARTLFALGAVRRRAKQKAGAREALAEALAVFERLGAPLWAGKARAELARIGGRPPGGGDLTPTEQRLAELVAEGRSNREVAAALFVTPKTVETTLSRIYGKLGVHSRTQLSRWLAEGTRASKL